MIHFNVVIKYIITGKWFKAAKWAAVNNLPSSEGNIRTICRMAINNGRLGRSSLSLGWTSPHLSDHHHSAHTALMYPWMGGKIENMGNICTISFQIPDGLSVFFLNYSRAKQLPHYNIPRYSPSRPFWAPHIVLLAALETPTILCLTLFWTNADMTYPGCVFFCNRSVLSWLYECIFCTVFTRCWCIEVCALQLSDRVLHTFIMSF